MVQLQFLSGKMAGDSWVARRFPVRIGRGPGNELQLAEDGVWDQHCELRLDGANGFVLVARNEALVTVNHQPAQDARLRNGDSIEIGAVKLRFWLSQPRQRGLRAREWSVWTLILFITLAQVALAYMFMQ